MKFLIAGYGSIGRRHMQNLLALDQKDIFLYRSMKSTLPEDGIRNIRVETDLFTALEQKPDAVIISNPTARHLDVAIPAARAGCAVFMEKPVSNSLERMDEFKQALQVGRNQVLVGFQFRFHPGLIKVKELLSQSAIGRPVSFRSDWGEYLPGWHQWEDYRKAYAARADLGGGVVLTLCHPLDYFRWLLGDVQEVSASVGHISDLEMNVEDFAEINLTLENGVRGSLHLDYYRRPGIHRFEIIGSQGMITWDNADGVARIYQTKTDEWTGYQVPEGFERNCLFLDEMRHFLSVVKKETLPACTLEDGIRTQQLVSAIYRSSDEKRVLSSREIYSEGK